MDEVYSLQRHQYSSIVYIIINSTSTQTTLVVRRGAVVLALTLATISQARAATRTGLPASA